MRHAGTLVEINDGGLSVGAKLALGGAGGIAGLQRMSATMMLAALFAVTAVDVELSDDRPTGDFGLELLVEVVLDDLAAAIGALFGQRCVMGFINAFGRRRLTMGVLPVLVALFATGL